MDQTTIPMSWSQTEEVPFLVSAHLHRLQKHEYFAHVYTVKMAVVFSVLSPSCWRDFAIAQNINSMKVMVTPDYGTVRHVQDPSEII